MAAELTKMVQGTPMQRKLKIILGDFIKGMPSYPCLEGILADGFYSRPQGNWSLRCVYIEYALSDFLAAGV